MKPEEGAKNDSKEGPQLKNFCTFCSGKTKLEITREESRLIFTEKTATKMQQESDLRSA